MIHLDAGLQRRPPSPRVHSEVRTPVLFNPVRVRACPRGSLLTAIPIFSSM